MEQNLPLRLQVRSSPLDRQVLLATLPTQVPFPRTDPLICVAPTGVRPVPKTCAVPRTGRFLKSATFVLNVDT